jgi:curved DNA-binding protein CbpA
MADDSVTVDHYETLQISANAEVDTIHRVYRLLAQRFHPDNSETGDESRFRLITEAYRVLSDPALRAQFDVKHAQHQLRRWRLVSSGHQSENDFETEQILRLTVLEALYTKRRMEPGAPGLYPTEFENLIGQPREHIEFALWFLIQKQLVERTDDSRTVITGAGVEYLEQNYRENLKRRRLSAGNPAGRPVSRE